MVRVTVDKSASHHLISPVITRPPFVMRAGVVTSYEVVWQAGNQSGWLANGSAG